jgi:hypothetical protein
MQNLLIRRLTTKTELPDLRENLDVLWLKKKSTLAPAFMEKCLGT